jgi:hypothetical protein
VYGRNRARTHTTLGSFISVPVMRSLDLATPAVAKTSTTLPA